MTGIQSKKRGIMQFNKYLINLNEGDNVQFLKRHYFDCMILMEDVVCEALYRDVSVIYLHLSSICCTGHVCLNIQGTDCGF